MEAIEKLQNTLLAFLKDLQVKIIKKFGCIGTLSLTAEERITVVLNIFIMIIPAHILFIQLLPWSLSTLIEIAVYFNPLAPS